MKITSESNTIERRDDGPVTRVVPRFMIVPNFLSGAFLFGEATDTQTVNHIKQREEDNDQKLIRKTNCRGPEGTG